MSEIPRYPALLEFQVTLQSRPVDGPDERLEAAAAAALEVLESTEGPLAFALGPVAAIDLDARSVDITLTVEAADQAELHQKMAEILGALQRSEDLRMQSTETRESEDGDLVAA